MRHELELLICAFQFLTRLPTPALPQFEPAWISRSAKYFPLVGQLVGAISGVVMLLAAKLWPLPVAAALAVVVAILITGAFHEDGLADTADGLGGGHDVATRLAIMKDSRIGTYGALALGLSLLVKIGALATIPPEMAVGLLIFGHGAARFAAVIPMALLPYAGDPAQAKARAATERVLGEDVAVAAVLMLWPLFFVSAVPVVAGAVCGILLAKVLALTARRLVGGQTGDILGAIEQLFELGFVLGAAAAVRHVL